MDVRSLHFCPAVLPNLFDVEICLQSRSVSQDISLGNVAIFREEQEEEITPAFERERTSSNGGTACFSPAAKESGLQTLISAILVT